ncbi:signal recognition particle-docking protein FtsY [Thermovirga lienii DSM 17291]|jgi:fused signal recognition particle receptor|uniref:Signal recognition particle receptor FtsY n=1 Tax=Thermovirga lienii (strain ATCC BAA-1197 / DSM 17291 / Cas60314) TaxID=580340 RepID=G7VAB3_THELD|nr:signal recognition particle-docking protein FtsY [Thermovirga lienii]MDN5318168.1 fused signal recognition particle receptor [Thermovirga sp.]AER66813.1 signal recognition particle-docking protein FtsY [Thermovirga lienii DSM 17291]KUK43053.1 MAG: Signal recognition particle receptor FtsY [Thermovirga lienii]MDN5367379.1 fused signal recognition particle receptor [Thermovirga sp.]HCD71886.1 signal recognition particle-docking protein FtsY [Thermovirga lienii]
MVLGTIKEKLAKVKNKLGIANLISKGTILSDSFWEELEELLIQGDVGIDYSEDLVREVKDRTKREKIQTQEEVKEILKEVLREKLGRVEGMGKDLLATENKSLVVLVGVNGTGKTTTAAKLARLAKGRGKRPILVAADTFRAAATEQLKTWGERLNIKVIAREPGSDPASVVFDAIKSADAGGGDFLVVDTAGRIHTKKNLMDELGKVIRVAYKETPGWEKNVLLVLDAVTGQNGLLQAKTFGEALDLTGVILTKYDNTAKGGILLAIAEQLNIPIYYVGLGEGSEDLVPFSVDEFINGLLE